MPRRSAADAQRTREDLVARAAGMASVEGLEGVTLGRLAAEAGMSKAGVIGHFGSKEALQLAAVELARRRFEREVWEPVAGTEPGLERLLALCDAWIADVAGGPYPGGCFFAGASPEVDGRPGPVRDAVARTLEDWDRALRHELRTAIAAGDLPAGTDVAQVVFELRAIGPGLNQELQMHGNHAAVRRARRAVRRIVGRPELGLGRRALRGSPAARSTPPGR